MIFGTSPVNTVDTTLVKVCHRKMVIKGVGSVVGIFTVTIPTGH